MKLEQYMGTQLKRYRQAQGFKLSDVAEIAEISQGMLSKIENAQVSTTLETLSRICDVLGIRLAHLFHQYDKHETNAMLVKATQRMDVVRGGTAQGHRYHLLHYARGPKQLFEAYLVSIEQTQESFAVFSHVGNEMLFMLEGEICYQHGDHIYHLGAGDCLSFDASIPHGPVQLLKVPIRFISLIHYGHSNS